ncbi:myb-related protein Hv33 [Musa troglodytarum]|uniref:Myb-related protein Hv33 n=1 Tax=Musa troglodytarum TaxID=320322 RepID=A0A9E7JC72_9LILI|nr:myb-related protein Hv33 [Musa troglodytarum]
MDAPENFGYGESSSNSGNWNCNVAPEMKNVFGSEALNWGCVSKVETLVDLMNTSIVLGERVNMY